MWNYYKTNGPGVNDLIENAYRQDKAEYEKNIST
jgi:hypothetical protein